jgi:hypothetical protein
MFQLPHVLMVVNLRAAESIIFVDDGDFQLVHTLISANLHFLYKGIVHTISAAWNSTCFLWPETNSCRTLPHMKAPARPQWKDIRLCHYHDSVWKMSLRHIPTDAYVQGEGESYYDLRLELYADLSRKVKGMEPAERLSVPTRATKLTGIIV